MSTRIAEPRVTELGDPGPAVSDPGLDRDALWACYREVRRTTEALCAPLEVEDCVIQSMPDASPTKWHLAHTTWFFETFILSPENPGLAPVDPRYPFLFNSYYNAVGERIARDRRGLLSRPTVSEVFRYRAEVDRRVADLLGSADEHAIDRIRGTFILGLNHEQQHQELILTDLKHALADNPLRPAYRERGPADAKADRAPVPSAGWCSFPAAVHPIGHAGATFAFDNETPRHSQYVDAFALADRPVTNREFLAFIEDGGYSRPEFWLSDGWFACQRNGWTAPLYWESDGAAWRTYTLDGMRDVDPDEPVCHVSYYEADAFARWGGARLATEAEWETAAKAEGMAMEGNFLESGRFHPAALLREADPAPRATPARLFGDVWEWTQSPYTPYRGYRPAPGALGEYNGKFMCNQMVLRGGSCATPGSHIRATYRNFFPPEARWQFSGIRLARDV
jgi:ergothioneine biosynthesis protein EgtB